MKRAVISLFVFSIGFSSSVVAQDADQDGVIAHLASYEGVVHVVRAGLAQQLAANLPLQAADVVVTGEGRAKVSFLDQSEVDLRSGSRIAIEMKGQERTISVFFGRVRAHIQAVKDRVTRFQTGATIAAIRGTKIEYGLKPDGTVIVGVIEGSIEIEKAIDGQTFTQTVWAGQKSEVPKGAGPQPATAFAAGDILNDESLTGSEAIETDDKSLTVPTDTPEPETAAEPSTEPTDTPTSTPSGAIASSEPDVITQGTYAAQLVNALGISSALPSSATARDIMDFLTKLGIEPCRDRPAPLTDPILPFRKTSELLFFDGGSGNLLQVSPLGEITIALNGSEIKQLTGQDNIDIGPAGVAFDKKGDMVIVDRASGSVIQQGADGTLTTLVSPQQIEEGMGAKVTPQSVAFANNDELHLGGTLPGGAATMTREPIMESISPGPAGSGAAGGGIVGLPDGSVFRVPATAMSSDGKSVSSGGAATRGPNGDVYFVDKNTQQVMHMTPPDGPIKTFVNSDTAQKAAGGPVEVGSLAFDGEGRLVVADANKGILRFSPDGRSGEMWISAADIQKATGASAKLIGGMAFRYDPTSAGGWDESKPIQLEDLLCIAGIDPDDPEAPLAISLKELIERILKNNSELFWLQSRRVQTVSPFGP